MSLGNTSTFFKSVFPSDVKMVSMTGAGLDSLEIFPG